MSKSKLCVLIFGIFKRLQHMSCPSFIKFQLQSILDNLLLILKTKFS
ncbi:hypothetical protein M153_3100037860 [Pseudoloma neurophilia]|uniref:Uncharacterized protein n=1 Tax=Pseudoloma neurophilia TaxID=146866 RepID=A0A0R0M6B0_9MICR|nr:hypothetical protein M153_3100037860 [Pseudoloma neurophilia]